MNMQPINEGLTDAVLDRANEIFSAMKSDKKAIRNAIKKHSGE